MNTRSLGFKIVFLPILLLVLLGALATGIATWAIARQIDSAKTAALKAAKENLMNAADSLGTRIEADLETSMDAARTLAQALEVKEPSFRVRDNINQALKAVLQRNPSFLGVYTCWEPGAFDGKDASFAGKPGHDATGRFIPYWNRNEKGEMALEPLKDYEKEGDGDYYLLPKKSKQERIINPYFYEVQGKKVLLTSMVAPVIVDGAFAGIAGVDMGLDSFQAMADKLDSELYEGATEVLLIANDGIIVAAGQHPEHAGKQIGVIDQDSKKDLEAIREGKAKIIQGASSIKITAPFVIGHTATPWGVQISIPVEKLTKQAEQATAEARKLLAGMLLTVALFAVAGLAMMLLLSRRIVKVLNQISSSLGAGAEQTANAASQVASSSEALAQGSNEQASSLEETSASIAEMSSMTSRNAENAAKAKEMASVTMKSADKGSQAMESMNKAIDDIKKSSDSTAKIVKTIDEIAFQTNLLALNAAVEAARAGEAGKGFAVVAEEVRSLAQRSAEAAKSTAELIEESVKNAGNGVEISRKTSEALKEILAAAKQVDELVGEISAASGQQAQGVSQISTATSEMEKVTQSNAAIAEEVSSASEELSAQAEEMKSVVKDLLSLVSGKSRDELSSEEGQASADPRPRHSGHLEA